MLVSLVQSIRLRPDDILLFNVQNGRWLFESHSTKTLTVVILAAVEETRARRPRMEKFVVTRIVEAQYID